MWQTARATAKREAAPAGGRARRPVVVRAGCTVGVLLPDLRRFEGAEVRVDDDRPDEN